MIGEGTSKKIIPNTRIGVNTGYVIIPANLPREDYIANCFRSERVSIQVEDGGTVRHQCIVGREVMREIVFPEVSVAEQVEDGAEISRLGSQVAFIDDPYRAQPIIFTTLSKQDEIQLLEEDVFKVVKDNNGNYAIFSMDGKTGGVNITTLGADSGGDFNISVNNKSQSANLNLKVKGDVNIDVTGDVNLVNEGNVNVSSDGNVNLQNQEDNGLVNMGFENLEPLLLGDKTVEELEKELKVVSDILQSIANIVPSPVPPNAVDPTWAIWQAAVAAIVNRGDYSQIKSEKSFTE